MMVSLNMACIFAPIDEILLHIICSFKAKSLLVINVDSPEREFRTFCFLQVAVFRNTQHTPD